MSYGEEMKRIMSKKIGALTLCAVILFIYIGGMQTTRGIESVLNGTVSSAVTSNLNVREGPGTNKPILKDKNGNAVFLTAGAAMTILDTVSGTDGGTQEWYKVTFTFNGQTLTGYVRSDYVTVTIQPVNDELSKDFEESIAGFPNSYKPQLRALHLQHPDWVFKAFKTGLDWNTVIKNETVLGRSLTSSSVLSYRSTAEGAYDWSTDTYIPLDGGGWYQAADGVVKHYIDPRNFLDEKNIFQFEALYYDAVNQKAAGVEAMLSGTFMDGVYIVNGSKEISYTKAYIEAAKASKVSPYHLVSRTIQEVGRGGSSSVSGTVSGYVGIYNYYNIGATSGANPVLKGLKFAKTGGSLSAASKTKYLIPWNTRYKAIVGGAKYIAANYISIGQNTLYLQKFDVDASDGNLYWHQYMTNISAAASEASIMYDTYKELGILDQSMTFSIPVYNNIPANKCPLPAQKGSPNNLLKSLSVSGFSLTPTFEIESKNTTYNLIINGNIKSIKVTAVPVNAKALVSGSVGTVPLSGGKNTLKIKVTAVNGKVRSYTLIVVLNGSGGTPTTTKPATTKPAATKPATTKPAATKPATTKPPTTKPPVTATTQWATAPAGYKTSYLLTSGKNAQISGVQPQTSVADFITKLGLYGGASAALYDSAGQKMTSGVVGTGCTLKLNVGGDLTAYTVLIRGDVDGDGSIGAVDLLMVRKNILGRYTLKGACLLAADADRDSGIGAVDLLMVRKHILKTYTIEQS